VLATGTGSWRPGAAGRSPAPSGAGLPLAQSQLPVWSEPVGHPGHLGTRASPVASCLPAGSSTRTLCSS
jgi:hypothetical protein